MSESLFVTVTIGRNVGEKPMSKFQWENFRAAAYATYAKVAEATVGVLKGTSCWDSQYEDTYAIQGLVAQDQLDVLRAALSKLARTFDQEAVGLHIGEIVPA